MRSQQLYVITGASGAGKSTLIAALRELGYSTLPEAALAIMREQKECNGTILLSGDLMVFMESVLARSVQDYEKAQTLKAPVFFDRGIPEWSRFLGSGEERCHAETTQYRYANTVFVAEPWPEIYICDHERVHSFEQAAKSYITTISAYVEAGYEVCVIPKAPVQEHATFILAQVSTGAQQAVQPDVLTSASLRQSCGLT
ncbi:MAG: AAA family ATPase [Betaproteobacteria bacterium]|nr:AAA family ATPase [Betaproteobacteria bacterium]